MSANKYIILCIVFFMVIPCKTILAQEIESDTVQSELDIKYDSVLSKAISLLTASAYQEAIRSYKDASALKPAESYPYKMILYIEDIAAKQKRSDDLKRKAQIREYLDKANKAIVDRSWDTAKSLFNNILTLHPEKADEEYAKSKIEAIDLELKRIALRTPVKEEPKPVIVPKNRREARAMRKLAKRNASLASVSNKEIIQKPAEVIKTSPAPSASAVNAQKNIGASTPGASPSGANKISYQILQHFNEDFKGASNINWTVTPKFAKADFLQDEEKVEAFYDPDGVLIGTSRYISIYELPKEAKRIFATKYAGYHIQDVIYYEGAEEVAYYITTEDNKEKVVFRLTGSKDITVFSRESAKNNGADFAAGTTKVIPQKLTEVPVAKNIAVAAPLAKQIPQKPAQAQLPDKKIAVAPSSTIEIQQKPGEVPSAKNVGVVAPLAKQITQKPAQAQLPDQKIAVAPSSIAEIQQKPGEVTPAKNIGVAASSPKVSVQPPAQVQLPDRKVAAGTSSTTGIQQKAAEVTQAKNLSVAASSPKVSGQPPAQAQLPDRKIAIGTSSTAGIPQKHPEVTPVKDIAVAVPPGKELPGSSLPDRKAVITTSSAKETQQKPAEVPPVRNIAVTAPSTKEIPQKQVQAPLAEKAAIAAPSTEKTEQKSAGAPVLNLYDSSNYVKLICQDISFIGSNAYIKVLVQNYSATTDFLTDTLRVSIKKNNGIITKLDQRFISNFPVVKPLNESVLVFFADALLAVQPDDTFILQMEDKMKKTQLVIQVPWSMYKQQKNL